eukprot:4608286-Pyramimonas_sp.AAC.1
MRQSGRRGERGGRLLLSAKPCREWTTPSGDNYLSRLRKGLPPKGNKWPNDKGAGRLRVEAGSSVIKSFLKPKSRR